MKRTPKAWNGGSVETAMKLADERTLEIIKQGATICASCRGAGIVLPPEGLKLEPRLPTRREAAAAAILLLRCNGHDFSQWTDDLWPDHDATEALKMLAKGGDA